MVLSSSGEAWQWLYNVGYGVLRGPDGDLGVQGEGLCEEH